MLSTVPGKPFKAYGICTLAYVLALGVALWVGFAIRNAHPVIVAFTADMAGTCTIFLFSCMYRNASFYDPYWSVAPIPLAVYWLVRPAVENADSLRQIVVITLVLFWAVRLTYNWASQWQGLGHEDWRYRELRQKWGKKFWLIDLFGIELFPTCLVFLGSLSLYASLSAGSRGFSLLDVLATAVTAGAIAIEATADKQLRNFPNTKKEQGQIMQSGLWRFSRHPNYFGEILFWWGLYLFALSAAPRMWWTLAGPLAMVMLFVFISVPLMDRRNLSRRAGYQGRISKVSAIIPWFPKSL